MLKQFVGKHEHERNGIFTRGQLRKNVDWPQVPIDFESWSPKREGQENEKKYKMKRGHCFSYESKKETVCVFSIIYIFGFYKIFLSHFSYIFGPQNYERCIHFC